jgi:hypothetical protein
MGLGVIQKRLLELARVIAPEKVRVRELGRRG